MHTYNCPACGHANEDNAKFCGSCGKDLLRDSTGPSRVGTTILGRYTIERLVASGGMGVVYQAAQTLGEHHRTVAIKMLRPELSHDHTVVSRFNRECGIVAQLSHQNTVRVYDFGTAEDGTLYIAMEFVRGTSLADLIGTGPLPVARTLCIVEQICHALHEAHELGIVHRDLKPDNVILTQHGSRPDFVKLLDFGIAVRLSAGGQHETKLTQQGIILGTPPYMSPEQFTGAPVTRQSDLYSLGIIVYEALTGGLPFTADTPLMWAQRHLTSEPPDLPAAFPSAIVTTIRAALAKEPAQRPRTAIEMYRMLAGESSIDAPRFAVGLGASRVEAPIPVKTAPDVPPLESDVLAPRVGPAPTIRTDPAGSPIMADGAPVFAGMAPPASRLGDANGVGAYTPHIFPASAAVPPKQNIRRRRGIKAGVFASVGLLLVAVGLTVAYSLGAIDNPFADNAAPSALSAPSPNLQPSVANASTTIAPEVTPPAQNSPEPTIARLRGTAVNPGTVPRHGSPAAPSSSTASSADASVAPASRPFPSLIPGFPSNLPSLPTSLPPLPTSIAGIPIPPLFPGAPQSPSNSPPSEPQPGNNP